jgi:hypothetical protein
MKVSTENDNNFGYEKITILVDNIPLTQKYNFIHVLKKGKGHLSEKINLHCEHMSDNISGHLSSLTHSLTCKVLHKFVLVKMDIKVTVQNGH